jgi:hypothetical protein
MMMLNEAARCFDEQVIRGARDGDIGAVFGIGFPPFLGGPFRYMDQLGAGEVVAILQRLAAQYGPRFTPCENLLRMAGQGQPFGPLLNGRPKFWSKKINPAMNDVVCWLFCKQSLTILTPLR